jgi:hypothetical protein
MMHGTRTPRLATPANHPAVRTIVCHASVKAAGPGLTASHHGTGTRAASESDAASLAALSSASALRRSRCAAAAVARAWLYTTAFSSSLSCGGHVEPAEMRKMGAQ